MTREMLFSPQLAEELEEIIKLAKSDHKCALTREDDRYRKLIHAIKKAQTMTAAELTERTTQTMTATEVIERTKNYGGDYVVKKRNDLRELTCCGCNKPIHENFISIREGKVFCDSCLRGEKEAKMLDYVQAVQDLEYWQAGQHFFTCELYALMARADRANFAKLALVFPVKAKAYSDWYNSPDPEAFLASILQK